MVGCRMQSCPLDILRCVMKASLFDGHFVQSDTDSGFQSNKEIKLISCVYQSSPSLNVLEKSSSTSSICVHVPKTLSYII